jgi:glutaminase
VFARALDMVGEERVSAAIGVEPSGEAFNSIRLTNDNRPFNPMVNAGAIACSGLIHQVDGAFAFERIREKLSQFAGRELGVDDAVHASEALTGNRNRAIAWLLRNYLVLQDDVDAVLDTYSGNAPSWSRRATLPSWQRRLPIAASIRLPAFLSFHPTSSHARSPS